MKITDVNHIIGTVFCFSFEMTLITQMLFLEISWDWCSTIVCECAKEIIFVILLEFECLGSWH